MLLTRHRMLANMRYLHGKITAFKTVGAPSAMLGIDRISKQQESSRPRPHQVHAHAARQRALQQGENTADIRCAPLTRLPGGSSFTRSDVTAPASMPGGRRSRWACATRLHPRKFDASNLCQTASHGGRVDDGVASTRLLAYFLFLQDVLFWSTDTIDSPHTKSPHLEILGVCPSDRAQARKCNVRSTRSRWAGSR